MTTDDDDMNNIYIVCLLYTRHCPDHFITITSLILIAAYEAGTFIFPFHFIYEEKRIVAFSSLPTFWQLVSVRMRIWTQQANSKPMFKTTKT